MREKFHVAGKGFSKRDFRNLLGDFSYRAFRVVNKAKEEIYSYLLENDVFLQVVVRYSGEGLTSSDFFLYGRDREDLDFVKKGLLGNLNFF